MEIFETSKLVVFIMFVIPGFVALRVYDLLYPAERIDGLRRLVEAVSYSCVNYALLSPLLIPYWSELMAPGLNKGIAILTLISVFFLAPVGLAFLWRYLRLVLSRKGIFHHPTGRPWDFVFQKQPRCWVKIYLKDNKTVLGGYYGYKSFASSAPEQQEIFLEEAWKLNGQGGYEKIKSRSTGLLVMADVISHIEFRSREP